MKLFTLFYPNFLEWPIAIGYELQKRYPGTTMSGIVSDSNALFNRVNSCDDLIVPPLERLETLEQEWLSKPLDENLLLKYEEMFGTNFLRRLITADRRIGHGFVSGGVIPRTRLDTISEDIKVVRRYIVGMIDYVYSTLEKADPDLVFYSGVASSLSLCVAEISKYQKIPFARFMPTRMGSSYVIDGSQLGLMTQVKEAFEKGLDNTSELKKYLPIAKEYLEKFRANPDKPEFAKFSYSKMSKKLSLKNIFKETLFDVLRIPYAKIKRREQLLRRSSAWNIFKHNLKKNIKKRVLITGDGFLKQKDLPERPFVYFPLHFDPEATTMVFSPMNTNQVAVLEALAKSIPLGMNLVVKEHIPMLGLRPQGYYKSIKRLPGVFLLSPFEDNFSLIKKARLTCVITGTAAWEAMLLKKPALIIGNSSFLSIGEGAVHCPDLSKMPEAVGQALKVPPASDEKLVKYIAATLSQSFEMQTNLLWEAMGSDTRNRIDSNPGIKKNICDRLIKFVDEKKLTSNRKV